ncbi:hypothetical protein [Rhizomicrobium electricum]|jgi:hypothetical protein|uniref:Uncharacterized protein n=1 Tax=Rhizomicrobium electricum TaxID=480070 RepID=A0ABN1F7M3_9PROT|nr:hypothetical protein [Rhizomicrobium electricum]NIJ50379.1 hypothetical protein [Rhizomicrobium electricum]
MFQLKWSAAEKKIARSAYDAALHAALNKVMTEFKQKAQAAASPSEMWDLQNYLGDRRWEISSIFIYSYSKLPLVFAWSLRNGCLEEKALAGLSDDKLKVIRSMAKD